ncbi:MAG: hypothetical protein K1X72_22610 [Pyrinomonadaceae bacterium]|nr:hypothetical protein [Pyrinomonadaceae bacterium]
MYLAVFFLILNAGLNYVPVAYNAEGFKQEMNAAVMQGLTIPPSTGTPVDVTKKRLITKATANDIPADAYIDVKLINGVLQARVIYNKKVSLLPFGIYDYNYQFDYTSNSRGFLTNNIN